MALGHLEREVMDVLWRSDAGTTAYDIQELLPDRRLAATTVLTVLSRLEKKGLVQADRSSRPHRFRTVDDRATHVAELMRDALGEADDRGAVLERFVGTADDAEVAMLRRLLDDRGAR